MPFKKLTPELQAELDALNTDVRRAIEARTAWKLAHLADAYDAHPLGTDLYAGITMFTGWRSASSWRHLGRVTKLEIDDRCEIDKYQLERGERLSTKMDAGGRMIMGQHFGGNDHFTLYSAEEYAAALRSESERAAREAERALAAVSLNDQDGRE